MTDCTPPPLQFNTTHCCLSVFSRLCSVFVVIHFYSRSTKRKAEAADEEQDEQKSAMGFRQQSETLAQRANFLRESLQKSQSITEQMVSTLGSFDQRLSNLESAMRPTQVSSSLQSIPCQFYSSLFLSVILKLRLIVGEDAWYQNSAREYR